MKNRLAVNELAALVKAKRGDKGLREAAAEIEGVSASTLSRVEQGKAPDLDTFLRLTEWLQISPEELFETENDEEERAMPPISPTMDTPKIIEVHLRADKELNPETAEALVNLIKATYNAVRSGKLRQNEAE